MSPILHCLELFDLMLRIAVRLAMLHALLVAPLP